jgi:transposase-like protein
VSTDSKKEEKMAELAKVGSFCPNPACSDYEQLDGRIIRYGRTRAGVQRFKCLSCGRTFTATRGTIFYRRRTEDAEIVECLALLAEGSRISSVSRVKGHKEDTVAAWLTEAAEHVEAVENVLLSEFRINRGQLDGLWSYVKNKGGKKRTCGN